MAEQFKTHKDTKFLVTYVWTVKQLNEVQW
jgi:hypothetical protein